MRTRWERVKNDNLVRVGEEGGGQAEFFGELINGRSLKKNKKSKQKSEKTRGKSNA